MENNFQNATGKSMGEIIRDIAEFLTTPCIINPAKRIDLCALLPDLNMREQLAYALLAEADLQGWSIEKASHFCKQACGPFLGNTKSADLLQAFGTQNTLLWNTYTQKYGNRFSLFDSSYWSTALSLGIDCDNVEAVLKYLRQFLVILTEFAYMENNNPEDTYCWGYYESFRKMLDELIKPPAKAPHQPIIHAIGGTAGKRDGDAYYLSLGVDLENPDAEQSAINVNLDITLKDASGKVITVIKDRIFSIPPKGLYHYGVTRQIRGVGVASITAVAKASSYRRLPETKSHLILLDPVITSSDHETRLEGSLAAKTLDTSSSAMIHYQFRNRENKILGGGSLWCFDELSEESTPLSASVPVPIRGADQVALSLAFDNNELT